MNRPGVVRREVIAEGKATKKARPGQRLAGVVDNRIGKQRLGLRLNLVKAILAPGKQIGGDAKTGQDEAIAGPAPEKTWLAEGLLQENGRIHPRRWQGDGEKTAVIWRLEIGD